VASGTIRLVGGQDYLVSAPRDRPVSTDPDVDALVAEVIDTSQKSRRRHPVTVPKTLIAAASMR